MKPRTLEQLRAFVDGVIVALDHRIGIDDEKMIDWVLRESGNLFQLEIKYVYAYETESREPLHEYETLHLDGTETNGKIVRDIEDMLERIHDKEIDTIPRVELLADAYDRFAD